MNFAAWSVFLISILYMVGAAIGILLLVRLLALVTAMTRYFNSRATNINS